MNLLIAFALTAQLNSNPLPEPYYFVDPNHYYAPKPQTFPLYIPNLNGKVRVYPQPSQGWKPLWETPSTPEYIETDEE